jgi:hypothetical protein
MAENRGKKFEDVIRQSFEKVPGVSIDRLHDQTNGFKGSQNICDFIVYKEPYEYYIECKSVHGNTLPLSNITETQWNGLLEKSKIEGVFAGVICWWIDKDVTAFIPIWYLDYIKRNHPEVKSINVNSKLKESEELEKYFDFKNPHFIQIEGKKKRVFFDYDMEEFLKEFSK